MTGAKSKKALEMDSLQHYTKGRPITALRKHYRDAKVHYIASVSLFEVQTLNLFSLRIIRSVCSNASHRYSFLLARECPETDVRKLEILTWTD